VKNGIDHVISVAAADNDVTNDGDDDASSKHSYSNISDYRVTIHVSFFSVESSILFIWELLLSFVHTWMPFTTSHY